MDYDEKIHYLGKQFKDDLCSYFITKNILSEEKCPWVLDLFFAVKAHMSAEEFTVVLEEEKISLSITKVTKVLDELCGFGVAEKRLFEGDDEPRYEPIRSQGHHDHFICVKCKNVIEFTDDELEKMQHSLIENKGYKPLYHKFEVYGLCSECLPGARREFPVSYVEEDTVVVLCYINETGRLRKRLAELGFVEHEKVRVVKNSGMGPVILDVKDSRIALGRGEADKIIVKELKG